MISEQYRNTLREVHSDVDWGTSASRYAVPVSRFYEELSAGSVLDYGCGKGALKQAVSIPVAEYDPAIPGKDARPCRADMVVCADVLEHVEPEHIDAVISDLYKLSRKGLFLVIACYPARKILPDGRNAHLIIRDPEWWLRKLPGWVDAQFTERTLVVRIRKPVRQRQRQVTPTVAPKGARLWHWPDGVKRFRDFQAHGMDRVVLCGGHPSITEQAELLKLTTLPVATMNNTATVVRSDIWFGMDGPENYDPAVLTDPAIMKIGRLNYPDRAVAGKPWREQPNTYFISDVGDGKRPDWLEPSAPFCWFKNTPAVAIQILYRMGFRVIFLCGMAFKDAGHYAHKVTQRHEAKNKVLYPNIVRWLRDNQGYMHANGLLLVQCTPDNATPFIPHGNIGTVLDQYNERLWRDVNKAEYPLDSLV